MILTVTPNACVDKTYRVKSFQIDRVNRPDQVFTMAGGKGVNVARVYRTLGGKAVATGFLGGINGQIIANGLKQERTEDAFVRVSGESRVCIAVIDATTGAQTEINESGPEISSESVRELIDLVKRLLSQQTFEFVVLSGSLPPGTPVGLYAELIAIARQAGIRAILDTSGAALQAGLQAKPWMIKPNRTELEALLGEKLADRESALQAARRLHEEADIALVALTLGSEGAVLVTEAGAWGAIPPPIEFAGAVASGDSFVAAFLWAWSQGASVEEPETALRLAVGAGAANAAVIGAGLCTQEAIFALANKSQITRTV